MHGSARVLVVLLFAVVLLTLHGPSASADGGCGSAGRPACTVLRPPERPPLGEPGLGAGDCVVLIGGLGSTAESTEIAFAPLVSGLNGASLSVLRYDSLGRIATGADALRRHVESLAPSCAAIHLIAHSMGGVVADRAFSMGLSDRERIATYVPLASPHNGSTFARALCGIDRLDGGYTRLLGLLADALGLPDLEDDAICDLARVKGARPPRGVESARLRIVTDPLVTRRDHAAPYRDVRELLPGEAELEGHGAILRSERARALVERAVVDRVVPADERSAFERVTSGLAGAAVEPPVTAAHEGIGSLLRAGALAAGLARRALETLGIR